MKDVTTLIVFFLPVFVPVICGVILSVGFNDNVSRTEIEIKKVLLYYYLSAAVSWFSIFTFFYSPVGFVLLNVPALLSSFMMQVYFYQLIYILTKVSEHEPPFSRLHYLVPVIVSAVMLVWSLFVPFDVQMSLATGERRIHPDYEAFSTFFFCRVALTFVFSLIYTYFIFKKTRIYFRIVNTGATLVRKPGPWLILLLGLTVAWLVVVLLVAVVPREKALYSVMSAFIIILLCGKHIVLLYNIIRRRFLLYVVVNDLIETSETEKVPGTVQKRKYERRQKKQSSLPGGTKPPGLDKKRFEAYMHKHKPFLDPEFQIADLVEQLEVNRACLSGFINRTYGVNFNRYINRCRLEEVDRLAQLSAMQGKDIHELAAKAGFASFRNYTRAVSAEQAPPAIDTPSNDD